MERKISKEEFVARYGHIRVFFVEYSYYSFHFECDEFRPYNIMVGIVLDCDELETFEVDSASSYTIEYLSNYGKFIARHTNGFFTEPDEDE